MQNRLNCESVRFKRRSFYLSDSLLLMRYNLTVCIWTYSSEMVDYVDCCVYMWHLRDDAARGEPILQLYALCFYWFPRRRSTSHAPPLPLRTLDACLTHEKRGRYEERLMVKRGEHAQSLTRADVASLTSTNECKETAIKVYQGLIEPYFTYYASVWEGMGGELCEKLRFSMLRNCL